MAEVFWHQNGKDGKLLQGCCLLNPSILCADQGGVEVGAIWELTADQWEEEQMKGSDEKKAVYGNRKVGHMAIRAVDRLQLTSCFLVSLSHL